MVCAPTPCAKSDKDNCPKGKKHAKADGVGVSEFRAVDVACGPYSTWVVGSKAAKPSLGYDDDPEGAAILKRLRGVLYEENTLVRFF